MSCDPVVKHFDPGCITVQSGKLERRIIMIFIHNSITCGISWECIYAYQLIIPPVTKVLKVFLPPAAITALTKVRWYDIKTVIWEGSLLVFGSLSPANINTRQKQASSDSWFLNAFVLR